MKIVINKCYGGFGLSPEAELLLWKRGVTDIGTPITEYFRGESFTDDSILGYKSRLKAWREYLKNKASGRSSLFITTFSPDGQFVLGARDIARNNPQLIRVVEELGGKASGACADLGIVEIPDDVDYIIEEYDGREWIAEKHRTWP